MATAAAATRWAREYETIYIMRPSVTEDQATKVSDKVADVLKGVDAKLASVDNWGKRKLAYEIDKHTRGVFVYIRFFGYGGAVAELERNLRLSDQVIRYQTILLNEDVDLESVVVDAEAVKFLHVESEEEEEEMDTAKRLGMVRTPKPAPVEAPTEAAAEGAEASASETTEEASTQDAPDDASSTEETPETPTEESEG